MGPFLVVNGIILYQGSQLSPQLVHQVEHSIISWFCKQQRLLQPSDTEYYNFLFIAIFHCVQLGVRY